MKVLNKFKTHIYLIIFIIIGTIIRTVYFVLEFDTIYSAGTYVKAAGMIAKGEYTSFREPTFPFFGFLLILIIQEPNLSVKLVSFISGILVIPTSYFVFRSASLKIFRNDSADNIDIVKKSKYIALLGSFFYTVNAAIVVNSAHGLREELISLLFLLIFYFIFVKDDNETIKDKIIIIILISAFTLIHLTLGIFTFLAIFFCFLVLKSDVFNLKFNISSIKMILISISFLISITGWFIHCTIIHNDPFYTINITRKLEEQYTDYNDKDLPNLINSLIYGLEIGIYTEFEIFMFQIGFIFIILALFSLVRYRNKKEIFFLSFILIINLLYLSPFIAFWPRPRLLLYFYPFIFFLGFLTIVDIWYDNKEIELVRLNFIKKNIPISINLIFILYLIFFILTQIFWHIIQINQLIAIEDPMVIYDNLFYDCLLIQNILLAFLIFFPYFYKKRELSQIAN
ncbi:MAG: hypothetical protein ACFFAN_06890 [Promethearchaeota archaeon]